MKIKPGPIQIFPSTNLKCRGGWGWSLKPLVLATSANLGSAMARAVPNKNRTLGPKPRLFLISDSAHPPVHNLLEEKGDEIGPGDTKGRCVSS